MPKYGFTKRELSTYFKPNKRNISSFGRVFDFNNFDVEFKPPYLGQKDYIKLCIYSIQTNQILQETILRVRDLSPNYDLKYLKLNIGQHLRDLGIDEGDYKVLYKFLRKIAGDNSQFFVTDESDAIYDGPYESFEGSFYKVVEDVVDLTQEVFENQFTYAIDTINTKGDELILRPNGNTDNEVYISNLRNLDLSVVAAPNYNQSAPNKSIKFSSSSFADLTLISENPSEEDSDFQFQKVMEGQTIVFENFMRAWVPKHSKYAPKLGRSEGQNHTHGAERTGHKQIRPVSNTEFPLEVFTDNEYGRLSGNKLNETNLDKYSGVTGYYYEPAPKLNTTNTSLFNEDNLPKDWWLAKGQPATYRHPKYKKINSKYHNMWDTAAVPMYPVYTYDDSNDEVNIDWEKSNPNSPRPKDFGTQYSVDEHLVEVYFDLEVKIDEVLSGDKVKVSHNLQDEYKNLRRNGYFVDSIGVVNPNHDTVNPSFKFNGVNFNDIQWSDFYIKMKLNSVERFKTYLQYRNDYYLITNSQFEESKLKLKLKEPLNAILREQNIDGFTIVEELLPDYEDNISLIPSVKIDNTFLFPANFDNVDNLIDKQSTDYKTHNTLLSNSDELNRKIERSLVSGSLLDVQPNIDYQKTTTPYYNVDDTGFGNYIHFSNAESRIGNFKKKLELIETHNVTSQSLVNITSSLSRIQETERKRQRVINSFDPLENYLYFESSSYSSGSNGLFHDTSWPKETSTEPYRLVHTSGSTAVTWYNNMISSASSYDFNNMNSLRNSLPEHIYADTQNNTFLEFMDMTGQQFDEVWTYTKHFTDINKRMSSLSEGISKHVARHYADALGLQLSSGNGLLNLPEYLFGKSGSGADLYESPQEAVTEEIWKRILGNLPFFIKTKGTERCLKGLLNCYGIPSSILRVREYGGPDKGTRVSYEIKRKFTRALDFKSGQYIQSVWKAHTDGLYPDSLEVRFRSPKSQDQVILQKNSDWAISLEDNGATDELGRFRFTISGSDGQVNFVTSSLLPLYNDDMWSVMLTRKDQSGDEKVTDMILSQSVYEITAKQYDSTRQRIVYQESQSLTSHTASLSSDINNVSGSKINAAFTSSGHIFLGGSGSSFSSNLFTGSLMEYRLWSEPLSQSVFDNHVRAPKAYNGNTFTSTTDNLLVRYELNDNTNLQSSATASSTAYLNTYETVTAAVSGFTGNFFRTLVDQEKLKIPNIGPSRRNATKIRLETNSLIGQLNPHASKEVSSQDFAPIDSEKLGVYLSPTDVVNEDIIYSLADFNFDDYIGDPRDEFEYSYRTLEQKKHDYFKRYAGSNSFWDYMRILTYYDKSIFKTLKQFIPARARAQFGTLIEPNILERTKEVIGKKPSTTQPYYENAGQYEDGLQISRFISGSDNNTITLSGAYPNYESIIIANTGSRGTNISTLVKIDELNPNSAEPTTYATASVTRGGTGIEFKETIQPFISGSRLSVFNQVREYYYSSSYSASVGSTLAYSSSFEPTDLEPYYKNTISDRLFYEGTKISRLTDITGEDPVQITFTSPTSLITQQPGESKLRVE